MALPICCITGRIAGDGFACGDCDPCLAAHAVPEPVKELIKERDEFADKYEGAMMAIDDPRCKFPDDCQYRDCDCPVMPAPEPKPRGNESTWKLVMAMKLNGLPKEALDQGFMAEFEIRLFEEYWARSYAELCKGSTLHD